MSQKRKVPDVGSALVSAEETKGGRKAPADTDTNGVENALDPEALRALSEEISRESRLELTHTALVLYDRDPEHLQAQWHVAPDDLSQARRAFPGGRGDLRQVLRLHRLDQGQRTEVAASVVPEPEASNGQGEEVFALTGALSGAGAEYECELGLETDDGGWLLLARSNRIGLADRNHPIPKIEPEPSPNQIQDSEAAGVRELHDYPDIPVEPALAAVGRPLYPVFPTLDLGIAPADADFAHEEQALAPRQGLPRDLESESSPVAVQHPAPSPENAIGVRHEVDLAAMPPPLLPSMPDLAHAAGVLATLYDPRAALSSAAPRGVQPLASDFELQAELIVQGRASPGSTVDLFGHAVPVGADGRFYIRRPIEDPHLLSLVIGGRPVPGKGDPEPE